MLTHNFPTSMSNMISNKQYLLSSVKLNLSEMIEMVLNNGCFLYIGDGLKTRRVVDDKKNEIVLLGEAFCTNVFPRDVSEDFIGLNKENFLDKTQYWTGRWVLVYDNELITDACGLMSAFYYEGTEYWCVSSSLALMEKALTKKLNFLN